MRSARSVIRVLALGLLGLMLLALILQAIPAGAEEAGATEAGPVTVRGTVVNGTAGAGVPPGIPVTIVQLDQGFSEIARRTVPATPGGSFEAGGWDGKAGNRFVVSADHQDVIFRTPVTGSSGTVEAKVTIYEPTSDATVLGVASDTLTVVPGSGNVLEALQILRVDNSSDRAYVGTTAPAPSAPGAPRAPGPPGAPGAPGAPDTREGGDTPSAPGAPDGPGTAGAQAVNTVLQLPVPAGAYDLAPQEGSQEGFAQGADGGIFTASPLLPGETVVSFLYRVKVPSSGWALRRPVTYPTAKSTVLLGPGLTLDADRYTFKGSVNLQNRQYGRWDGPALPPGGELAAKIGSDRAGSGLVWGLGGVLAGLLAGAVALPLFLRRRRRASRAASGRAVPERARLIEEIAALDDALESGSVSRREHAERRGVLKQRLMALSDVVAPP